MNLPKYVRDIYLFWRNSDKEHKHIYLRTPHFKTLNRKTKEFQKELRRVTNNDSAHLSMGNLIELMTQRLFKDEPEMERHINREVKLVKEIRNE